MNVEKQIELIQTVARLRDQLFTAKEACKLAHFEVKEFHQAHCPGCPGDCPAGAVMRACKAVIGEDVIPFTTTILELRENKNLIVDCETSRNDTEIRFCGTGWYSLDEDRNMYIIDSYGNKPTFSRIRILDI